MIKKLLILAYDFPPYVSVGGLRPYNWYKYLHEFGVEPVVVTRQWSNEHGNYLDYIMESESPETVVIHTEYGTKIRTPYQPNLANRLMLKFGESRYRVLRRSISAYYELAQWFWNVGPKSQLYKGAREYLKTNRVDAIIATGDPFILFKYASKLSKEFDVPWIADYRDPWTQNKSNSKNLILKTCNHYLEKKYSKNVELITTVSDFFKAQISLLIKDKKISIVPNGYDPDAIDKVKEIKQQSDVFRIGFVGTISKWHPIQSFISVLSDFLSSNENAKLEVNFYGINIPIELQEFIDKHFPKIKKNINIYSRIPNDKLLMELAKNNMMLLFNYYSIIGTKIYDYLALNRAILLCYANDKEALKLKEKYYIVNDINGLSHHLQEDLINELNAGYIAQDATHLRVLLGELYKEFEQTGEIKCNTQNVEQFSRREQAGKLAEIVKQLTVSSEQLTEQSSTEIQLAGNSGQREAGLEIYEESSCAMNFPSFQGGREVRDADLKDSELGSSFHDSPTYQQCTRCVMDTSDVDIHFDEQGVCNHCTNYFDRIASRVYQGEKSDIELLQLIEDIKKAGKGKKYDCVIGVSGGVDSSYVAYKAQKRGLRALLVHMDNGWNSEPAVLNIKYIVNKLGFDYETYVLNWEEFKDLQLSFLRASVPEAETPTDVATLPSLHKIAAKYGVKYVISGGNFATEGILPKTWHYNAKDVKYLNSIHSQYGTKKLKTFPKFSFYTEMYYKFIKGIRIFYILNYIPFSKDDAVKTLEDELGWKYYGGKHYESRYTSFIQSYVLPVKFNIDYRRATFSTQICNGDMTREFALEELEKRPYENMNIDAEKEYLCKKLGIKIADFENIMNQSPKIYRDYPNDEKRLEFIYNVYRKLKEKKII